MIYGKWCLILYFSSFIIPNLQFDSLSRDPSGFLRDESRTDIWEHRANGINTTPPILPDSTWNRGAASREAGQLRRTTGNSGSRLISEDPCEFLWWPCKEEKMPISLSLVLLWPTVQMDIDGHRSRLIVGSRYCSFGIWIGVVRGTALIIIILPKWEISAIWLA